MAVLKTSTSGLGGVWAEEHTREALFAAMQRRETFGTSGVRIKVRLFGGWAFHQEELRHRDWVKIGYEKGVPMGSDLSAPTGKTPSFVVWTVKDPDDANLDRVQIIKGWTKHGQIFEGVFWRRPRPLPRLAVGSVAVTQLPWGLPSNTAVSHTWIALRHTTGNRSGLCPSCIRSEDEL
jgi:hypothetical protein